MLYRFKFFQILGIAQRPCRQGSARLTLRPETPSRPWGGVKVGGSAGWVTGSAWQCALGVLKFLFCSSPWRGPLGSRPPCPCGALWGLAPSPAGPLFGSRPPFPCGAPVGVSPPCLRPLWGFPVLAPVCLGSTQVGLRCPCGSRPIFGKQRSSLFCGFSKS